MTRVVRQFVRSATAIVVVLAVVLVTEPAFAREFPDVSKGDWYYEAVQWADANGVMSGYSDGRFGPDDSLMREQEATVLYRSLGSGAQAPATTLRDVAQGEWFSESVNWVVSSGTMTGYGDGTFGVGRSLTRQELAVVMARICNADVSSASDAKFASLRGAEETADWARASVVWAVDRGIINGFANADGSYSLGATVTVTRSQMATVMMNAVRGGLLGISTDSGTNGDASGSTAINPTPSDPATPSGASELETVYVTASGAKFHRESCPTIRRSKSVSSLSRADAIARGYTPCKTCEP